MTETDILRFAEPNFHTIKENETVANAISLMSKINQSELIVVNQSGEFVGKTTSLALFNKQGTLSSVDVIDKDCVFIKHDDSVQAAMKIASDFVGEVIPIVQTDQNKAVAIITEGAIFQAYLSKQSQTVEMEKR